MTCEPSVVTISDAHCDRRGHPSLCWGAVLAGTLVALASYLLLATLGGGAGLAICSPPNSPADATFSAGAAIVWSLYAIIALSFGGLVAGRFSHCPRSGRLHGLLVGSFAVCLALPVLAIGTGLARGRVMKTHEVSLRHSQQSVVAAAQALAQDTAQRSQNQLASFVQEAVQSISTNAMPKADTRAEREVGYAVTKLFAAVNAAAFPANRLEVVNTLMVYTEMSAADATTTVDAWIASRKNLQVELGKLKIEMSNLEAGIEQENSATTDALYRQQTQALSRLGRWSFFSMLLALLGASLAGWCGPKCASRPATVQLTPGKPA